MTNRRTFLMLLMLGAALPLATPALADKGGGDKGGGDRGGGEKGGDKGGGDGGDNDGGDHGDGEHDNGDHGGDDGKDDSGDDGKDDDSGSGTKGGKPSKPDDDNGQEDDGDDDDRIKAAVKRGEAAPLRTILEAVRKRYKGEVVKIKLVGKGKKLQYRIRLIDASNNLIEVRVNAANAVIIGSTESGFY